MATVPTASMLVKKQDKLRVQASRQGTRVSALNIHLLAAGVGGDGQGGLRSCPLEVSR